VGEAAAGSATYVWLICVHMLAHASLAIAVEQRAAGSCCRAVADTQHNALHIELLRVAISHAFHADRKQEEALLHGACQ
jgi:hypothetical protein